MLIAKLYLYDIDYASVADFAMPYLLKWCKDQDSLLLDFLAKLISKEKKASGFSKFVLSVIPKKEQLAATLISNHSAEITKYLNDTFIENGIVAVVKDLDFLVLERSGKDMLRIELVLEDIDYEQTIMNLLPLIMQKLQEQEGEASRIAKLLSKWGDLPKNVLSAVIQVIPRNQRDELLTSIFTEYKQELQGVLNEMIIKNEIKLKIRDIDLKSTK